MSARQTGSAALPRPARGAAAWITIAGLIFLGLGALAGGIALVSKPDGSVMGMPVSMLDGSPFPDFLIPGLVLGGLFGVGSLIVAALGVARQPLAPFLAFAIGIAQMAWIVIELAIIGMANVSFFHPLMFGVGLVIAVAAVPWGLPVWRAWRARRSR